MDPTAPAHNEKPDKQTSGLVTKFIQKLREKANKRSLRKASEYASLSALSTNADISSPSTKAVFRLLELPSEILDNICSFLESPHLYNLVLCSKTTYKLTIASLYCSITISHQNRAIKLYTTMIENPALALLMVEFSIHTPIMDIYAQLHAASVINTRQPGYRPDNAGVALRTMALRNALNLQRLDITILSFSGTGKSEESRTRLEDSYSYLLDGGITLKRLKLRDSNINRQYDEDWISVLTNILIKQPSLQSVSAPYSFPPDIVGRLDGHLPNLREVSSTSKEMGLEQIIPGRAITTVRLNCRQDVLLDVIPIIKQSTNPITEFEWNPRVTPEVSLNLRQGFEAIGGNFPQLRKFSTELTMVSWNDGDLRGEFEVESWINGLIASLYALTDLNIDITGDGSFQLDFADLARPREVQKWFRARDSLRCILHDGVFFTRRSNGTLELSGIPINLFPTGPGPFKKDIKLDQIDLASTSLCVPPSVISLLNNPSDRRLLDETVMPIFRRMA